MSKKKHKHSKMLLLSLILGLSSIIGLQKLPYNQVNAHSNIAYPTEIFSIWSNSAPLLDGQINFNFSSTSNEWTSSSIYNLYNSSNVIKGKLFLQNNNSELFIGLDATEFLVEDPAANWGFTIFFDINHNGNLDIVDKSIYFISTETSDYVYFRGFNAGTQTWEVIETGYLGIELPLSGIFVDTTFTTTVFNNLSIHRQYELKIPFTTISTNMGKTIGIGFEVSEDISNTAKIITWPYISDSILNIRSKTSVWGDISFGEENKDNFQFVVEKNIRVKSTAIGYNNGTFMTSGDIDGNGDQELIISSNRTVLGDNNLLSIFDYVSGNYQRIWASWVTSHQSKITFPIQGLAAYDFDSDGLDEIYVCGKATSIIRFSNWNITSNDFSTSEIIFTHTYQLMGYIVISDANNDTEADLIFGDSLGYVNVLEYDPLTDSFDHDFRSPFRQKINGVYPYRIHAVGIGNIDGDFWNEVLFDYQVSADNQLSTTQLLIYERTGAKYQDNPDDDLSADSSITTQDNFGHTIIVDDVDNDLVNEIIIVGKNYLKIFESNSFSNPSPSLEFLLNDGLAKPLMAGGAAVGDLNNDGKNELIFGANNGTLYIGKVTDNGSTLNFILNWSGDFGSSIGFHGAMFVQDFDSDNFNEIAIGDNSGQILIIGKGKKPSISITSPSSGYVSSKDNVMVLWEVTDDLHTVHHIDMYVNKTFTNRFGGSQTNSLAYLTPGQNNITLVAYDFSGLTKSVTVFVKFDVKAPQVTITSPVNYYKTTGSSVLVTYYNTDPDYDFHHYRIYRNNNLIDNDVTENSYTIDLPSSAVWNITIVAVDDTLLEGKSSIFVIRDNIPPLITITAPIDGTAVKTSLVDIQWSASDSLSGLDHYDIYLDGSFYDTTTEQSLAVTLGNDKTYTIQVRAYDVLENMQSDSITIKKDTVAPTVYIDPISLPQINEIYYTNNPSLTISWNTTDNLTGSGISFTQITINGLLYNTYPSSVLSALINLGTDDFKNIYVITYDKAGNSNNDNFAVIFDTTNPTLEITNPDDNFTTGLDYVTISWYTNDAGVGIKELIVYVDGDIVANITEASLNSYEIAIPENKTYVVTVRSVDILNYYTEKSINVIHDENAPTIYLISPIQKESWINTTTINFSWVISNIDINYFEIYINETLYDTYSNITFNALIDFGSVPLDQYPLYNVAVYAIATDMQVYFDYRGILIDRVNPFTSIDNPNHLQTIIDHNLMVEWTSYDEGSGLTSIIVSIGNISIVKSSTSISHLFDVIKLDGYQSITILIYDRSGNKASDSILIDISLLPPDFSTSLPIVTLTNNPNIQFNLSIYNPRLGVQRIIVLIDNINEIFSVDYDINYKTVAFWLLINITENDFDESSTTHNVTITVFDRIDRMSKAIYDIIIDQIKPVIWQDPLFGSLVLNQPTNELELSNNQNTNIFNVSIYLSETFGIRYVNLSLVGGSYNQTFQMIKNEVETPQGIYEYIVQLNLTGFEVGEYQLIFNFEDIAGNTNSKSYILQIAYPSTTTPPNNNGYYYIYIIFGVSLILILAIVLAVVLRNPISNIGWQKELVVVAYILHSGLTGVFVPYSSEFATDEQLFGGAMKGIRGILEEIIGRKTKNEIETVEFGDKHLLIYPGIFGDVILIVKNIKPNHYKTLSRFAKDFEYEYKDVVKEDTYVNLKAYQGATDFVKDYFGPIKEIPELRFSIAEIEREQLIKDVGASKAEGGEEEVLVSSFYHEIKSKYGNFDELSPAVKLLIGDAIILAEKSLTLLINNDFKEAEKRANASRRSLEMALEAKEPIEKLKPIFEKLPQFLQLIINGAHFGRKGNTEELYKAISEASQILIEQIIGLS